MKRLIFFLLLLLLSFLAQSQKVIHDANAEVRPVAGFNGVSVSGGIDLYLSNGDEAVVVSASKQEFNARILTEVKDGVLKIWYEAKAGIQINWNEGRKLKAYVSYKILKSIQASGGSDVTVDGTIKSTDLTLVLSGGSDFKGEVDAGSFTVKQSGGSDVNVSGKATTLVVQVSGGSDFSGYNLATEICHAEASGGCDVEITATKELTAKAHGASDISYKGTPSIKEVNASGASSVKAKS